jgi:hypothetical protein
MSSAEPRPGCASASPNAPKFWPTVPTYFYSLNGHASSEFSDLVVSFKRELPVPLGFHLSATGGLGFPNGASKISSHSYDPYIQFPWSRRLIYF